MLDRMFTFEPKRTWTIQVQNLPWNKQYPLKICRKNDSYQNLFWTQKEELPFVQIARFFGVSKKKITYVKSPDSNLSVLWNNA